LSSNKKFNSIPEIFLKQIEYDFIASNIYSLLYKDRKYSIYEPDKVTKVLIHED
jgi:hypothetical protein